MSSTLDGDLVYLWDVLVLRATEKALLCQIEGEERWIPRSQCNRDGDIEADASAGTKGSLVLPKWFAEKEGLV